MDYKDHSTCVISACGLPSEMVITFDTNDKYSYCDNHGWRFRKGQDNRKGTRVVSWSRPPKRKPYSPID